MDLRHKIAMWTMAHRITAIGFLLLLLLGRLDLLPFLKGSVVATRLLDALWLADPLATLEVMGASRSLPVSLLLATAPLILQYALVGRAFCGWLCPLGLLLDINDLLRERLQRFLGRRKRNLPNLHIPSQTGYWILAISLILSFSVQLPVFQTLSPINMLARSIIFLAPEGGLVLVLLIALSEYAARRAWCRALCPLGALYSLIGRWGLVRVLINYEVERKGRPCGLCSAACPMGIPVVDYVRQAKAAIDDQACTRCGACVDRCPRHALQMGLILPGHRLKTAIPLRWLSRIP